MNRQEMDPLADVVPPRHAYESDDEDEVDPNARIQPVASTIRNYSPSLTLDLPEDARPSRALLIALGPLGKIWASGAKLGESVGRIGLDRVGQLAVIFKPSWFEGHVFVIDVPPKVGNEILWRIGETIIHYWLNCKTAVILDAYDAVNYKSTKRIGGLDDPVRILASSPKDETNELAEAFESPNFLQGCSAAIVNSFSKASLVRNSTINTIAVLAPSREYDHARLLSRDAKWSTKILQTVHQIALKRLRCSPSTWTSDEKDMNMRPFAHRVDNFIEKKREKLDDMNMYI